MKEQNKLISIIILLLLLLFFRDIPYLNIVVVNKIWIFYLFFILYLLPFRNISIIYVAIALLLAFSVLLLFISFPIGAEIVGVVIYVGFWILAIHSIWHFFS